MSRMRGTAVAVALLTVLFSLAGCTAPPPAPTPTPTPPTATPAPTATPTATPTPVPVTMLRRTKCTGSMEPAITCLDALVKQRIKAPEDVDVGDVVSFPSNECWPGRYQSDTMSGYTSHRIVAVRAGEDGPEYLTQGDNNLEPDCWLPFEFLHTKVVEVRRGLYPANAALRNAVNLMAEAARTAIDEYLDHIEAACGHRGPDPCPLKGAAYDTADYLFNRADQLAADHDCWVTKAVLSEYPGHIPASCVVRGPYDWMRIEHHPPPPPPP